VKHPSYSKPDELEDVIDRTTEDIPRTVLREVFQSW
jgi:hypothetical protein